MALRHDPTTYASGGSGEMNDCAVRALATAACVDYEIAHETCERHGRKIGQGMLCSALWDAIEELSPGAQFVNLTQRVGNRKGVSRMTVKKFVEAWPSGHFVIFVADHFFAVYDGVVHNWDSAERKRVKYFWRLCR